MVSGELDGCKRIWHESMNPPWLSEEQMRNLSSRVCEIDAELGEMGASPAYCEQYFQSGGGTCERIVAGECVRHRSCQAPLPCGKMCSVEYGETAAILQRRTLQIETERKDLRKAWESLKEEQTAVCLLADSASMQVWPPSCSCV
jgi:hypothetical protein